MKTYNLLVAMIVEFGHSKKKNQVVGKVHDVFKAMRIRRSSLLGTTYSFR